LQPIFDQVAQYLAVDRRRESMTRRGQRVPQPDGIFDDSVVNQADSVCAVVARMCVVFGD
jgi:hypothetical protein